jgi:hypothetical protein
MAIRNDLTINWSVSPRIITVASPSNNCTMQDLYDTLRWLEATSSALDNPSIVNASGKEPLDDAGTKVGLTVSLQDAQIGFEARGDWTNCALSGGNLVAYNSIGQIIDPINPTAFVNITRTSSASATLQEQDALQYASYGNVVTIKASSDNTGIAFPSGTQEYPVNNMTDALAIAVNKGFYEFNIIGVLTLDIGDVVTGYKIKGSNTLSTVLTVNEGAIIYGCEVRDLTVSGTLDGGCVFRDCNIMALNFVSGIIFNCGLNDPCITLGGNSEAVFLNTYSLVSGTNAPCIDMNGVGQSLGVRGYSGGLRLKNRIGNDPCSIDMASGHLIIDSSCTGGAITVRGVCKLTVEVGATTPLIEGKAYMVQDELETLIPQKVWEYQLA